MKLLLIHVPKTAGVSVMTNGHIPVTVIGHHATAQEVRKQIGIKEYDNYFSFAVVRNPYERFLSSYYFYRNVYSGKRSIRKEINKYKDFTEFCLDFQNFEYKNDLQFKLQSDFVFGTHNGYLVDYLCRYERLDNDWEAICNIANVTYKPLPVKNTSHHGTVDEEYTIETLKIVYALFKKDFLNFGY